MNRFSVLILALLISSSSFASKSDSWFECVSNEVSLLLSNTKYKQVRVEGDMKWTGLAGSYRYSFKATDDRKQVYSGSITVHGKEIQDYDVATGKLVPSIQCWFSGPLVTKGETAFSLVDDNGHNLVEIHGTGREIPLPKKFF